MDFITNNWTEIGVILLAVVVLGERGAALTENKVDDVIFGTIHKVLVALKLKFPESPK